MTGLSALFAAVDYGGDWVLPEISHLFEFPPIPGTEGWQLGGIDFALTRTHILLMLSALIAIALFMGAFGKAKIVPGKFQAAMESLVEFVRDRIAIDIIGPEGVRYVPLLTAMFIFIFINNLFKLTPFVMFPPTSRMAITGFLAVIAWLTFVGVGFKHQGVFGYLKGVAFPPGVPKLVYLLLTPIEIASNFILRPFTLAVRLFANMVAGHILVVITLVTIHVFLALRPGLPVGIFALVASPLVFAFELLVISLQAYIFTMLTAVYIGSALHAEH